MLLLITIIIITIIIIGKKIREGVGIKWGGFWQDSHLHISFTFVAHMIKMFPLEDATTLEAKLKLTLMQITEG